MGLRDLDLRAVALGAAVVLVVGVPVATIGSLLVEADRLVPAIAPTGVDGLVGGDGVKPWLDRPPRLVLM